MLKHAGQVYEDGRVSATLPGELSIKCPACPHPEFNLPDNWAIVLPDIKYVDLPVYPRFY